MTRISRWHLAARLAVACSGLALAALAVHRFAATPALATPPVTPVLANVVAAEGAYGKIKGRLVWGGSTAPTPKPLDVNKDTNVCGKGGALLDRKLVVDSKTNGVKWGLAYIVNPKGTNPGAVEALLKKEPKVQLDQKYCEYVPYVVGMNEGQSLLLKSSDAVNHNVHLNAFTNEAFNVILPPNGEMTKKLVAERRPMSMTCDIHPWMQSYIMVYNHPFFAVTDADGSFEIDGVPAGPQKLVLWQPAVGYVTPGAGSGQAVTVVAGKTVDAGEIKLDPAKVK
ncbi:MAG: hypothetical protein P4L84_16130 [Isosphaeraceae bacterium]|nr:hypothetical protein [Isosphaeraceae bacterium]